jgi:competence protein ComEC
MQYNLRQAPFIRLLPPLVAGILIRHNMALSGWMICLIPSTWFLLVILTRISGLAGRFTGTRAFGLTVYACLFFFGMGLVSKIDPEPMDPGIRIGTISSIPEGTGNSYRVILDRIYARSGRQWSRLSGKALVYLHGSLDSNLLKPGHKMLFYAGLDTLSGPENPMAFNAREYYGNRKIYWQTSPGENNCMIIRSVDLRLTILAERLRWQLIRLLNTRGIKHAEIITALLTGYREGLDDKEEKFFIDSGAMHIMAVSGLHTGLIYGMISMLLSLFFRKGRRLRLLLPIPFIWLFALVTGLSPSVCRAALMITLFAVEACSDRQKNYYNVLFFSAFLLIVINPAILFDISFQLSFTAVFGIVSCFIPAYRRCRTGWYIPDRIIGLLLLSVFAQLFTFPLSSFYFHQFPHYFLLTNLLVVPLVPLILYAGTVMLVLQFLPAAARVAGEALNLLSGLLLHLVEWISHFPHSVTTNIYFRPVEVVIIYTMILSVMVWFRHRLFAFLLSGIAAVILLLGIDIHDQLNQRRQKIIHVYHNRRELICDLVDGKEHIILMNNPDTNKQNLVNRWFKTYWLYLGLRDHQYLNVKNVSEYQSDDICIRRCGKIDGLIIINYLSYKLGLLRSCPDIIQPPAYPLQIDGLVLYGRGEMNPDHVLTIIWPEEVIAGRNISRHSSKSWEQACQKKNIPFHSIYKLGYFMKEF